MTKPSRVRSNGRHARAAGSPSHWLIVLMSANALNVSGLSGASAAPATITSANPSRMYRSASPTATVPLAQLLEFVVPTPRRPYSMAMFVCADPPKTCKASVWLTPRVPFFKKCACWNSAPAMPPSAVPKLTPTRACGSSGVYFEARVFQGQTRAGHGELRVAVQPLEPVRREKIGGVERAHLARVVRVVLAGIERREPVDAAALRA